MIGHLLRHVASWFGWYRVRVIDKIDITGYGPFGFDSRIVASHHEWQRHGRRWGR